MRSILATEKFGLISCLAADLRGKHFSMTSQRKSREGFGLWIRIFSPRFLPILIFRTSSKLNAFGMGIPAQMFSLLNFVIFGIEISPKCNIGPGIFFPHTQGTVIGSWSIGKNVTIFQGVTLGAREMEYDYSESKRPTILDGVLIGAGAKILGGVTIGRNARIGANAVIIDDVPEDGLAVGIPARVIVKPGSKVST
jgi:serine O-acetyltransferase